MIYDERENESLHYHSASYGRLEYGDREGKCDNRISPNRVVTDCQSGGPSIPHSLGPGLAKKSKARQRILHSNRSRCPRSQKEMTNT